MSLYNVRKSNSGFTLVELLMTLIIISVIAALTAPSFLGLMSRNRVNEAALKVEGALKEAQRQAVRKGKQCTIIVDTDNTGTPGEIGIMNPPPPPEGCLLSNRILDSNDLNTGIQLNTNTPATGFNFSGKGNIDGNFANPVIVISMPNRTIQRKCVVLDGFFGVLKSGDYPTALGATDIPVPTSCVSTP
jgi:prepilin-type N-terminal cleavage/methylation domain-containing protein